MPHRHRLPAGPGPYDQILSIITGRNFFRAVRNLYVKSSYTEFYDFSLSFLTFFYEILFLFTTFFNFSCTSRQNEEKIYKSFYKIFSFFKNLLRTCLSHSNLSPPPGALHSTPQTNTQRMRTVGGWLKTVLLKSNPLIPCLNHPTFRSPIWPNGVFMPLYRMAEMQKWQHDS